MLIEKNQYTSFHSNVTDSLGRKTNKGHNREAISELAKSISCDCRQCFTNVCSLSVNQVEIMCNVMVFEGHKRANTGFDKALLKDATQKISCQVNIYYHVFLRGKLMRNSAHNKVTPTPSSL